MKKTMIIIISIFIIGIIIIIIYFSFIKEPEIKEYTINYVDLNKTITIKEGELLKDLPTITKDGYEFKGWYTSNIDGEEIVSNWKVTSNLTLYARWEEISKLEIHFIRNLIILMQKL